MPEHGTYVRLAWAVIPEGPLNALEHNQRVLDNAAEGTLVPPGLVAVNPDDLATLLAAVGELGRISVAELDAAEELRAALAASNPTTETPDA